MSLSTRIDRLIRKHNADVRPLYAAVDRIMIHHREMLERWFTDIFGPGVVPLNAGAAERVGTTVTDGTAGTGVAQSSENRQNHEDFYS